MEGLFEFLCPHYFASLLPGGDCSKWYEYAGAALPHISIVLYHSDQSFDFGGCFRALKIYNSLDLLGVRLDSFACYDIELGKESPLT